MGAIGIDIGGTKIELQVFDRAWGRIARDRRPTPADYAGLLEAVAELVGSAQAAHGPLPVGISAAGLVDRRSGLAITANLPATGRPFPADLAARLGQRVAFINDCQAMALSEARLGAGRGHRRVAGLILGTGVGMGVVTDGALEVGGCGVLGEVGHIALPAAVMQRHGLMARRCGCGRIGCYETLLSGLGLVRLAHDLTGQTLGAPEIAQGRACEPALAHVWSVWCDIAAELLVSIVVGYDPDCIVLGGGLSGVDGLCADLTQALLRADFPCLVPPVMIASEGGDATGARGAALAATQAECVSCDHHPAI